MSTAPVTTDSAAILGEAWPDNAVETASEQLSQVQQLAGVMNTEAESRAQVASSIRSVAESEGFEVGHSLRDTRVAAYAAQAATAQSALTQAWWAILGYSRALEGTLTAIVYAYQPRLDAARVLAATEPATGAAAYAEALAEAIAEREAALAAATSGITTQLTILSNVATQPAPGGAGGSTLDAFRGVARGQDNAASGVGAAAGVAGGSTLSAVRGAADASIPSAQSGAGGSTLSEFRGAATEGGGSAAGMDGNGAPAVLDSVRGEAAAQGPAVGSGSQIVSGGSPSAASSAAGKASGASSEIAGGAGVDVAGQAGASADVAADSSAGAANVPGVDGSVSGSSDSASAVAPQVTGDALAVPGAVSATPMAGVGSAAASQFAASTPPTAPMAASSTMGAVPAVAPMTGAGSGLAAGSTPSAASGSSVGPVVRTPSMAVAPYSPGASAFSTTTGPATGPGAAAAASGVAAGAVGGAAVGSAGTSAGEKVLSPDLRRAVATVAALVEASAGSVGWAVAVLGRPDGSRQYWLASTLAGGYIPRGVYPYVELSLAFPPPVAPADVVGLTDPAVALVEYQKLVAPDWKVTAVASSLPVAGIKDLIDPEVTQSRQVSAEDLVLSPMTELGARTVHRLDLVVDDGYRSALAVRSPAKDFFVTAWQAHEANASGPGARARRAVLNDLMVSREPMPATWDDLVQDHSAHAAALFGWGPVTEANASRYLAAFTDLMASETLLLGRGGNLTHDDLADALYAARLATKAPLPIFATKS